MATGSTEFIDNTTADVWIPEIWSKEAIVARDQATVFAELFNRAYEKDAEFGDTVNVGSIGHLSALTKSVNTAIVYETVTDTQVQILLNVWEYSAIAIETKTKKQSMVDLMGKYAAQQGYALALAIDAVLAGLVDDFSQTVGTLASDNTYDDFVRAQQYLDDANAPAENRALVISPAARAGVMKLDQFISDDYKSLQGDVNLATRNGYIGKWLGLPVYASTHVEGSNAAGHDNAMFHKEACALVVQIDMRTDRFYDIDFFADKIVVQDVYGSKELRDDHGVWLQGS